MDPISVFFIVLTVLVLLYFVYRFGAEARIPILYEVMALVVYFIVLIIVLFPSTLTFIENVFGITSALNFIVYLAIFVIYLLVFNLYKKTEDQRVEITKLTREIGFLRRDRKKNGKEKKN